MKFISPKAIRMYRKTDGQSFTTKKLTITLIELKNAQIKLHSCVQSLVVESHKLATRVPVDLRQKVRAVNPEIYTYIVEI